MKELIEKDYEGLLVQFTGEGWFNATSAAQVWSKLHPKNEVKEPKDWISRFDTLEYICAFIKYHRKGKGVTETQIKEIKDLLVNNRDVAAKSKIRNTIKGTGLIKPRSGPLSTGGGTWVHPKLAVPFARWLDVDFAIWCDEQIDHIIRGDLDAKKARHQSAASFKLMTDMVKLKREKVLKNARN